MAGAAAAAGRKPLDAVRGAGGGAGAIGRWVRGCGCLLAPLREAQGTLTRGAHKPWGCAAGGVSGASDRVATMWHRRTRAVMQPGRLLSARQGRLPSSSSAWEPKTRPFAVASPSGSRRSLKRTSSEARRLLGQTHTQVCNTARSPTAASAPPETCPPWLPHRRCAADSAAGPAGSRCPRSLPTFVCLALCRSRGRRTRRCAGRSGACSTAPSVSGLPLSCVQVLPPPARRGPLPLSPTTCPPTCLSCR